MQLLPLLFLLSLLSCKSENHQQSTHSIQQAQEPFHFELRDNMTLESRFLCPQGFKRIKGTENSFANFLQNLPLKDALAQVLFYNGKEKPRGDIYCAVVDLPIGKKDLHQCADAIMRLRADYLFKEKRYSQLHFNFTNGFKVEFEKWLEGGRMNVEGNKTYWTSGPSRAATEKNLWAFLELVFTYAGTASLEKELHHRPFSEMQIGDVFIQGGHPGHAVIVVDMAENPETGEKLFMLAQSYMPAQEIQILHNHNAAKLSPWYQLKMEGEILHTPEWSFGRDQLKHF